MDKKYIVLEDGRIGYVHQICTCEKCQDRWKAEIFINDLDGAFMDCFKANDQEIKNMIFFGDSLTKAVEALVNHMDKSKEIKYLQNIIDFYSNALVAHQTDI